MKRFNKLWLSTQRIFWAINIGFAILSAILAGFIFNFDLHEIWIQMGISISMLFPLVWIVGGYKKLKSTYSQTN
jgi:hypothetical protein